MLKNISLTEIFMILFHFGRYTDSTLSFPLSPYQPETFMLNTYGLLIDYVGNYEKDKIFLLIVIKKIYRE